MASTVGFKDIWLLVKEIGILKEYYAHPHQYGADFIPKLFNTTADQDFFLDRISLSSAISERKLDDALKSLQNTLQSLENATARS